MKEKFFVGIKDPVRVRRDLLTASKNIIDSLQRYDSFSAMHDEKQKYIVELKRVVDELLILNKKLRSHMPKTPLKVPGEIARKGRAKKVKLKEEDIPRTRSKLQLLENELSKVESRLKALE